MANNVIITVNMGAKVLLFSVLIVFYGRKHCFLNANILFSQCGYIVFSLRTHRIPALEYAVPAYSALLLKGGRIFICHPSAITKKAPVYGALMGVGGRVVVNFAKIIFIAKITCNPTSGEYR